MYIVFAGKNHILSLEVLGETMKRIPAFLFLWSVVSSWAGAAAIEIAVHPLHIESAPPSETTLNALRQAFREQVLKALPEQINLVEGEETACWGDDGCIVAMAKEVQASRVLLVSVVRVEPQIITSARILDAKGVELRNIPIAVHTPNPNLSEDANFADGFSVLFAALNLPVLLAAPAASTLVRQDLSGVRFASYAMFGVSAASLAVGVTFTALYVADSGKVKKLLNEKNVSFTEDAPEALKYMQRQRNNKRALIVGYAVGGTSLAASLVLLLLSPENKKNAPVVSFVPLQGGGALTMVASF